MKKLFFLLMLIPTLAFAGDTTIMMQYGGPNWNDLPDIGTSLTIKSADGNGGYITQVYSASSGTLTGATDKIELNIPTNWVITGCQIHVKVATTNAGDNTWSSALSGGASETISTGSTAAKNTNVTHFGHADASYGGTLTSGDTDITLTPQAANFTAGEIEATCIARGFVAWDAE